MIRLSAPSRAVLVVAALLAALSFVAWRQSRALEELRDLDGLQKEIALADARHRELVRTIQYLESRGRVVPAARERLDMHVASAPEIGLIPVESR